MQLSKTLRADFLPSLNLAQTKQFKQLNHKRLYFPTNIELHGVKHNDLQVLFYTHTHTQKIHPFLIKESNSACLFFSFPFVLPFSR